MALGRIEGSPPLLDHGYRGPDGTLEHDHGTHRVSSKYNSNYIWLRASVRCSFSWIIVRVNALLNNTFTNISYAFHHKPMISPMEDYSFCQRVKKHKEVKHHTFLILDYCSLSHSEVL